MGPSHETREMYCSKIIVDFLSFRMFFWVSFCNSQCLRLQRALNQQPEGSRNGASTRLKVNAYHRTLEELFSWFVYCLQCEASESKWICGRGAAEKVIVFLEDFFAFFVNSGWIQ